MIVKKDLQSAVIIIYRRSAQPYRSRPGAPYNRSTNLFIYLFAQENVHETTQYASGSTWLVADSSTNSWPDNYNE